MSRTPSADDSSARTLLESVQVSIEEQLRDHPTLQMLQILLPEAVRLRVLAILVNAPKLPRFLP